MLYFRKWLEDAGPVTYDRLSDEEETPYRSKYVTGKPPNNKTSSHDPDKVFGVKKSKRKMKKNG